MNANQIALLLITPMILGTGLVLHFKGALSRRGLVVATAATAAVFAVMFFSQ